jgi:serine protease Do
MKRSYPYMFGAAGAALVIGALAFLIPLTIHSQTMGAEAQNTPQVQAASPAFSAETVSLSTVQSSFREVAKAITPSVVELNVTEVVTQQMPFFRQGAQRSIPVSALGSGIIVSRSGNKYYVLTNNHVIDNATSISVKLNDQRTYKAAVVGNDAERDLAMVSFTSSDAIPVAALGNSSELQVGDIVFAVGNPLGFESTITMGIVSAVGRKGPDNSSTSNTGYIQTDASINEGNSGGALVNVQGQVIGINTWIAAPSGGSVGLGFAIPIDSAKSDIQAFLSKGSI